MAVVAQQVARAQARPMGYSTANDLRSQLAHLYRRAGFGATTSELNAAVTLGYTASVDALLNPTSDAAADALIAPTLTPYGGSIPNSYTEWLSASSWWMHRMAIAQVPIREKLPLFWHGLLTTNVDDVGYRSLGLAQNQLFRQYGMGDFEPLMLQITSDPAMLGYLNLLNSHYSAPNENYARELMELFAMGRINGAGQSNYTESDVKEAARALTGWTYSTANGHYFLASRWDSGSKTILNQTGNWGTADVIRIVTRHAASTSYIPYRLWSYFAYPISLSDPIIEGLAGPYAADRNIKNLLRAIFLHPQFQSAEARTAMIKTPIEWSIGLHRALQLTPGDNAVRDVEALQQAPFRPPSVAGWPSNAYWVTTASAYDRLRIALGMVTAGNTASVDAAPVTQRPAAAATLLGVDAWTPRTAAALAEVASETKNMVALAACSPEYVVN